MIRRALNRFKFSTQRKTSLTKKNLYVIRRRLSFLILKFSGLDSQKGEVNKTTMQNTKIS